MIVSFVCPVLPMRCDDSTARQRDRVLLIYCSSSSDHKSEALRGVDRNRTKRRRWVGGRDSLPEECWRAPACVVKVPSNDAVAAISIVS